jgi:hypothetical protein
MNVYQYITQSSPNETYAICQKYGYIEVSDLDEMAEIIANIVSEFGEDAFKEVMSIHPDKQIILELYQPAKPLQYFNATQNSEPKISGVPTNLLYNNNPIREKYFNAEGGSKIVNQTNMFILAGAVIVSLAIISSK